VSGPDVEATLIAALQADTTLAALVGLRVSQQVTAGPWPAVALHLAGGTDLFADTDTHHRPVVSFHCYGASSIEASAVARATRAALRRLPATTWTTQSAVIGGVEILSDLVWIPDTAFTPPQPHYAFTAAVVVRAMT
jgi:hypothetical protein